MSLAGQKIEERPGAGSRELGTGIRGVQLEQVISHVQEVS